ncbi:SHOCT domain-containing protein [Lysinibacillus xylanilyticus]|uniref:SHOCT domain-containing protein n=1 Tax=Lysinibacillus xylanilyticus TaxID=582475 RepID=UPI00382EFAE8
MKLKELLDVGILTQDEFDTKKTVIRYLKCRLFSKRLLLLKHKTELIYKMCRINSVFMFDIS